MGFPQMKKEPNQALEPTRLRPPRFRMWVSAPRCVVIPKKPAVRARAWLICNVRQKKMQDVRSKFGEVAGEY